MTRMLEWLLDLDRIQLGSDAPLSVQWQAAYPAWILAAFLLLLTAFIVLVHRRESGPVWGRVVTATLRTALLALLIAVVCQPVLVLQRERVEPSWVALLVDTSHSMSRRERYRDESLAASVADGAGLAQPADTLQHSRLDLVRRALLRDDSAALRVMLRDNRMRLLTFAGSTRAQASIATADELNVLTAALNDLSADGTSTDLPGALTRVLEHESHPQAGRLAAIVLASDGRSTATSSAFGGTVPLDRAKAQQIPILPLRVGSPDPPRNVAVGPVLADQNVFRGDLLAVRTQVEVTGLTAPARITLRLLDESDGGAAVASETLEFDGDAASREVEFRIKPTHTGTLAYRVEVDPLEAEDQTDDNAGRVEVRVLDDKLRVLYVEGYPRFEYRYLKNVLLREPTIESSCLLLDADSDFAQEGTDPIRRFPETPDELRRYDVVLLGDVDPTGDWLSPAQAQMLVEFVGDYGGGFGLIAGQQAAPHRFRGTPLEKLIPARIDPEFLGRYESALKTALRPRLTFEGKHSRIFRFDRDPAVSEQLFESLPGIYWTARTLGPRPGAEILLEHPGTGGDSAGRPLMVLGRYGAGRTFFSATDDTWRWRRHTGEFVHDVFWVQLVRTLMRPADTGQDRRLAVRSDRRSYAYGDRVELGVQVHDVELLSSLEDPLSLALLDARESPVARIAAQRVDSASPVFEASFIPPQAGSYVVRCDQVVPLAGDRPASTMFRVETADLEARRPEADHDLLARIAAETGGRVIDLDELAEGLAQIPDRSLRIPDDISEPLWDSKLVLALFVLMITVEWGLRKALGML